MEIQPL